MVTFDVSPSIGAAAMDEPDSTQWSAGARERYAQRTQELIAALSTHVAATAARAGRQRELELYERSCERLHKAANAFNEAEFDWCGSFPLPLDPPRHFEDQEDHDDEWTAAINAPGAVVMSFFGRWDWVVTDANELLAAGRNAYRELWTDGTAEDAELAVPDASSALREFTHAGEWPAIPEVPGLLRGGSWMMFTEQDSVDEELDEINPFRAVADPPRGWTE